MDTKVGHLVASIAIISVTYVHGSDCDGWALQVHSCLIAGAWLRGGKSPRRGRYTYESTQNLCKSKKLAIKINSGVARLPVYGPVPTQAAQQHAYKTENGKRSYIGVRDNPPFHPDGLCVDRLQSHEHNHNSKSRAISTSVASRNAAPHCSKGSRTGARLASI